ncbi:hypothetical protein BDZ45DRAFT_751616 [Acephala macrosclerotiorum]|nr:hypothetical protein BDZ45DRAFT_751616 [Acephala macrosclerotiorum]
MRCLLYLVFQFLANGINFAIKKILPSYGLSLIGQWCENAGTGSHDQHEEAIIWSNPLYEALGNHSKQDLPLYFHSFFHTLVQHQYLHLSLFTIIPTCILLLPILPNKHSSLAPIETATRTAGTTTSLYAPHNTKHPSTAAYLDGAEGSGNTSDDL